jgi:hypothetical protein
MRVYGSFDEAIRAAKYLVATRSIPVSPMTWQGIDITKKPEMSTYEVQWYGLSVDLSLKPIDGHRIDVKPNLLWADNHFEERVSGLPLNPGVEWANWPYAHSADKFRKGEMFNHSYAERYWPKYANLLGPLKTPDEIESIDRSAHRGIRYEYGDLGDVVKQLIKDPSSRQAVLPVFFPEDTGAVHGDRVPCSIFYQFMIREGKLDLFYYLRSCDFVRHFRDDIWLTIRLQLWVIDQVKKAGIECLPGRFMMQTASLHIFKNDWVSLFGAPR